MPIATSCPHCDRAYNLADATAGKNVKCKACGEPFLVQPVTVKPQPATPKKVRTAPPDKDDEVHEVEAAADDESEEADERPRNKTKPAKRSAKPRKKGGSSAVLVLALVGGALLLLLLCAGGGGALYFAGALGTAPLKVGGDGGGGGGLPFLQPQKKPAVVLLNDAADVLDTIKDKPSLDAAQPKLHDLGVRMQPLKPVMATAIFLGKEAPGMPPGVADQLAANVEKDPKFAPYLVEGKALAADPDFLPAYRRYNKSLLDAQRRVPGALEVVLKEFQIKF